MKEINKAYILPVRVDDTALPGLPETTGYLDIREQSATEIAQIGLEKLAIYKSKSEVGLDKEVILETNSWKYSRLPFQRSGFLAKNNYLDPANEDFARNDFSKQLVDGSGETAARFFSLVAVPIPEAIDLDLDELEGKLYLDEHHYQIGRQNEEKQWLKFSLVNMYEKRTARTDYLRFGSPRRGKKTEKPFQMEQYLRFSEDGAIEFVDGYHASYSYINEQEVFHFIYILSTTIMFMNLVAFTYSRNDYKGRFQLLVNLRNTENTILVGFASDRSNTKTWKNPLSDSMAAMHFSFKGDQGKTSEPNLQFAYDIDTKTLFDNPDASFDIMVDLSKKLQRSYNYLYEPRHYIPGGSEFPWGQYYQSIQ